MLTRMKNALQSFFCGMLKYTSAEKQEQWNNKIMQQYQPLLAYFSHKELATYTTAMQIADNDTIVCGSYRSNDIINRLDADIRYEFEIFSRRLNSNLCPFNMSILPSYRQKPDEEAIVQHLRKTNRKQSPNLVA